MVKYSLIITIFFTIYMGRLYAPVPSSSQTLDTKKPDGMIIDKNLLKWFDRADANVDYFDYNTRDFKKKIEALDEGAQIYLSMEKFKKGSKEFNKAKDRGLAFMDKVDSVNHPLYSYIAANLIVDGEINQKKKVRFWADLEGDESAFCARKKVLSHNLKEVKYGSLDNKTFEAYLKGIDSFNSEIYRRRMFDNLLSKVNKKQREDFLNIGGSVLRKEKQLQKTFTWLEEPSIKNSPDALKRRIVKNTKEEDVVLQEMI